MTQERNAAAARLSLISDMLDLGDAENAWAAIASGMLAEPETDTPDLED